LLFDVAAAADVHITIGTRAAVALAKAPNSFSETDDGDNPLPLKHYK